MTTSSTTSNQTAAAIHSPFALQFRPFTWFLLALFASHLLVFFHRTTAGFLPTTLTALLPTAVFALLYGITALLTLQKGSFIRRAHPIDLVVLAFMALSLLQVLNPFITVGFGLRGWQRTAFFGGVYFLARYLVDTNRKMEQVVRWTSISIALAGLVATLQGLFGIQFDASYQQFLLDRYGANTAELAALRTYGTLISQGSFGLMMATGLLLAMTALLIADSKKWRATALVCLAFSLLGLVLSGTRTAMVGGMLASLPLFFMLWGAEIVASLLTLRLRASIVITILLGIVALVVVTLLVTSIDSPVAINVRERIASISPIAWIQGDVISEKNLVLRVDNWRAMLEAIQERPLQGYGTGMWGGGSVEYRSGVKLVADTITADNQYIELAGELGVVGLMLFVAMLAWPVWMWVRWRNKPVIKIWATLALSVSLLAALGSIGQAALDFYPFNVFFWLMLGVATNLPLFWQDLQKAPAPLAG